MQFGEALPPLARESVEYETRVEARSAYKGQDSGQASVMIGMIVLTFILFFAFVVNTGMLVNAKINLQNAADLAAYAGAAVQARQLTTAAELNYEMRRQYKKFLFRYYVEGSFMYTSFPDTANKATKSARRWATNPTSPIDFGVPVVCLNLFDASTDNYCQTTKLPAIQIPQQNALDAINNALAQQLQALEKIRQNNCQTIADTNVQLLLLWLFNTNPKGFDPTTINPGADPHYRDQITTAYRRMQGITYGLGLIPREIFLRQRIATLQTYLNAPPNTGLTVDQVSSMQSSADPAAVERSINAFQSAFQTLGEHLFPDGGITMDELLPPGPEGALLANFTPILQDFDTYALTYETSVAGGGTTAASIQKDCIPKAYPITLRAVPLGVYKDPTLLSYYAVRLRGKARLLFSPFGDLDLKAYSAAMPFGGRIGPANDKTQDLFARNDATPPTNLVYKGTVAGGGNIFQTVVGKVPNLPVLVGEDAQRGSGWDSNFVQYHFYQSLIPDNNGSQISMQELSRGSQASQVPNPFEAGHYTIMNDLGDDPFVRNFDKYKVNMAWAPLVPVTQSAQLNDILRQAVDALFTQDAGGTSTDPTQVGQFSMADYKGALLNALTQYVTEVRNGGGEGDPYTSANPPPPDAEHEGINVAMLVDPLSQRPTDVAPGATPGPIAVDNAVMLNDPTKIRDAWDTVNDGSFRAAGRVGYSVKFVSFDSLQQKRFTTDGKTTFTNLVSGDTETAGDITLIKH